MTRTETVLGQPLHASFADSADFRLLTDEELLVISGGGVIGNAVLAGLQGAVIGGIGGAAAAAAIGQPIGAGGISGMVAGGIGAAGSALAGGFGA